MKTKKCTNPKCKQPIKPIFEFNKRTKSKDGFQNICKVCQREYRVENKTHIAKKNKEWDSMRQVERELKIMHGAIAYCCQEKYKQAGGYKWEYKNA